MATEEEDAAATAEAVLLAWKEGQTDVVRKGKHQASPTTVPQHVLKKISQGPHDYKSYDTTLLTNLIIALKS